MIECKSYCEDSIFHKPNSDIKNTLLIEQLRSVPQHRLQRIQGNNKKQNANPKRKYMINVLVSILPIAMANPGLRQILAHAIKLLLLQPTHPPPPKLSPPQPQP